MFWLNFVLNAKIEANLQQKKKNSFLIRVFKKGQNGNPDLNVPLLYK